MTKRKTWLLIAVAALASIATSPKSWTITATPPAGAPTTTTGSRGLLITVEASGTPHVMCTGLLQVFAEQGSTPEKGQYLCPSGTALDRVTLSGRGRSTCEEPKPRASDFVRITSIEVVETWTQTAELIVDFSTTSGDSQYRSASIPIVVHSPHHARIDATLEPGPNNALLERPYLAGGRDNEFSINIASSDDRVHSGKVRIRATVSGYCKTAPCSPPAEPLRIERGTDAH